MPRRRKKKVAEKSRHRPRLKINFNWLRSLDWHVIKRSGVGVAWILSIATLVIAWILGVPRLQAFASSQHHVEPANIKIDFIDQPQWANGPLADALLRTARMQVQGDPLSRADLVAIRQTLLETGWFHSVDQVRRTAPDAVEITAQFVRPYALIRDGDGYHLVDSNAHLLPKSYSHVEELPVMRDQRSGAVVPMIAISGVHFTRPAAGRVWDGTDVSAGLKLLQLLERQPWRHQVTEIDVGDFLNDGPMKLRTDAGTVIIWGGPPGEEAALELRAQGKLERLQLLFTNHGRIDGNRRGEIDITGERVTVAR